MGVKTDRSQWDRTEDSEISPHSQGHLKFDKGVKNYLEKRVFSINGVGKMGYPHVEN
jgi:hypothetical protein